MLKFTANIGASTKMPIIDEESPMSEEVEQQCHPINNNTHSSYRIAKAVRINYEQQQSHAMPMTRATYCEYGIIKAIGLFPG